MGNVRAIGQALFGDERLAQALYCFNPVERASGRDLFMSTEIHPVDQILPAPRLLALGLQHVLVMYAGAVAVPLIIGRALQLPPEDVAFLLGARPVAFRLSPLSPSIRS